MPGMESRISPKRWGCQDSIWINERGHLTKKSSNEKANIVGGILFIVFGLVALLYGLVQFPKPITSLDFQVMSIPVHQSYILNSWGRGGKIVLLAKNGEEFYTFRSQGIPWNNIINAINSEDTVTLWRLPDKPIIYGLKARDIYIDHKESVRWVNNNRQNNVYFSSGTILFGILIILYNYYFKRHFKIARRV